MPIVYTDTTYPGGCCCEDDPGGCICPECEYITVQFAEGGCPCLAGLTAVFKRNFGAGGTEPGTWFLISVAPCEDYFTTASVDCLESAVMRLSFVCGETYGFGVFNTDIARTGNPCGADGSGVTGCCEGGTAAFTTTCNLSYSAMAARDPYRGMKLEVAA